MCERALAVVIGGVVVAASGCSAVMYYGFPKTETARHRISTTVEVRSEDHVATVVGEDGEVLGTTPLTYETDYRVERTYEMRSGWRLFAGCLVDVGAAAYSTSRLFDAEGGERVAWLVGGVVSPLISCVGLGTKIGASKALVPVSSANDQPPPTLRAPTVSEQVLARHVRLEARWQGWPSVTETIVVPERSVVTFRRPNLGFDEAVIEWAGRNERAPSPEGLYRLGVAHTRFADESGDRGHVARAIDYFTRYLGTEGVSAQRRAEVEQRIAALRKRARGASR